MTRALLSLLLLLALTRAARAAGPWDHWQMLLWQDRTSTQLRGLAALGFTGTKLRATGGEVDAAEQARHAAIGLPYYLENLATDFYAAYHRAVPGQSDTALFDAVRAAHRADPLDPAPFVRTPGLSDPDWLRRVADRLTRVVRAQAPARPLFYNLADEGGIADLAAAWDFDVGATSLAGFRAWLRTRYSGLDALNREWETAFAGWDDVQPQLTDAAMRRTDDNFAAWSDFKEWMDEAFAAAVRTGTQAVHAADPTALAALEGAQVPGWGGYDYARLSPAVDVMEIYDYGEALDLAKAFNPGLIPLRTSFGRGPREAHAAWRHLLHGGRGLVVWDEANDVVAGDGTPAPRGKELAALAQAIAPVADILNKAAPDPDPVAILVNQESFRVQWLLDRRAGDHDWAGRDAEREYDDTAWRASRRALVRHLAEIGVQPRFISSAILERGGLDASVRVLLLPHAIALSDGEVAAIATFRAAGGTVLADTEPGLFDGHGRRRALPPLPDLPHPQEVRSDGEESTPERLDALAGLLLKAGVGRRLRLTAVDGKTATGVEARWFRHPRGTILALQTGRPWGGPYALTMRLPFGDTVTRLDGGAVKAVLDMVLVQLDGVAPAVLLLGR